MILTISIILVGISIALLVIYGADVAAGDGIAGNGFLPLDAMTRGIGLGTPPIILSIIAFFISKKEPSKGLGAMIVVSGILIIIGGAISLVNSEAENMMRGVSEGATLIVIGGIIVALGSIKIKKS
jgi:hypothetical protein